ncbi:HAD family hydrolase [Paenibacillus cymbidii]|uniref:HAD family hydrolase n=1 Tax=Paenibacillus cymbidii TaxID=1639034 RepID=UPI0010817857|nr:HAD family hydrolase [Paenibacillus cymbidii]
MEPVSKAVIFDLGGTLINYEGIPSYWGDHYRPAFELAAARLQRAVSEDQFEREIETLKTYNARLYPREIEYQPRDIFGAVYREWGLPEQLLDEAIDAFFVYFRRNVTIYPDTRNVLAALKQRGYPIGVLTDVPTGMPTELAKRDAAAILDRIDCFLASNECGFRKPHPRGLELLAAQFGVAVSETIFVGDEHKDIQTAKRAGARSVLIDRGGRSAGFGEDHRIAGLAELPGLLDGKRA